MNGKKLIIKLIQQDLKHCQLVYGLCEIGLDANDKHQLQLFDLVSDLIKVPETIEMDGGSTYEKYMKQALTIEMSGTGASLEPLAEQCFRHLKMLIDFEKNEQKLKKRN